MKSNQAIFCLLGIFIFSNLSSQQSPITILPAPPPISKLNVCEVSILGGFMAQSNQFVSIADFSKLAPNSEILKGDLSGYSQTSGQGNDVSGMFSILMGIRFGKKDLSGYKSNPIFRIGFSHMNSTSFASNYYQSESKRYDTLYSSQTGTEIFVDSLNTRNYNVSYSSKQIRLDLSLIYRTDGKARWCFYSGFGANVGVSLNAYTNINYYNYNSLSNSSQNNNQYTSYSMYPPYYYSSSYYSPNGDGQTETFKNKNNTAFSAYIPLGIDFRMGKKRDFWKRTHLFCEFRPGINSIHIPELGTYNAGFFQGNFGLKINWENI